MNIVLRLAAAGLSGWLMTSGFVCAASGTNPPQRCHAPDGAVRIPAGTVMFGEDGPGRPGRRMAEPAFALDRHEVTNRQFAAFVRATGYVTQAERQGGGAVFVPPTETAGLGDARRWWRFVRGADWRHPTGPSGSIVGHDTEPVVQVTFGDASAYARWAGGTLPSETQWERAARGTQTDARDPMSWTFDEKHRARANIFTGTFPMHDTGEDGFHGIAPVGCYPPNGFGLYDMIGNVWEWTSNDRNGIGLIKGGSFLCAANYCANFRPAAFQAQEKDLGTSHVGFRLSYPVNRNRIANL